jgi:hypothetical protein
MAFNRIVAWRCLGCGRILVTERGIENHKKNCKCVCPPTERANKHR